MFGYRIGQYFVRQHIGSVHNYKFDQLIYRTIYTAEQLSINKYERDRRRMMVNLLPDLRDLKRNHMQRILRHKIVPPTMMNDLMQFMHMIEDTESDFLLLESALNRIKTVEIDNLRQTSIGSVLMRLLHYFRKDEFAISVYNDHMLRQKYLDGKHCTLLFFDLLYKQQQYTEFMRQFQWLRERLESKQQTITRSIYVLVFATCYNQNTTESFKYAKELDDRHKDAHITQDHLIFLSALALNQNAPHIADKLLQTLWPTAHISIPSLRLISMLQMRKFPDALQLLRSILVVSDHNRTPKIEVFSTETVRCASNSIDSIAEKIDAAIEIFEKFCENDRFRSDFHQLCSNLQTHGYIVDKALKTMIYEPFNKTKLSNLQQNRMFLQAEFDRRDS